MTGTSQRHPATLPTQTPNIQHPESLGEFPLYFDQKVKCLTKGSTTWEYGKIRPTHPSRLPTGKEEHHRHIEVDLGDGRGIKTFCLTNGDRVLPDVLHRTL